jgi:putative NADPH-quinone reductase
MRILAVVAHDKPTSLTKTLFNHALNYLKTLPNTEIDILDLYDHKDEIPFYVSDRAQLEANQFYQENKERFLKADRLLIAFPVYWYSTPGILKCWFDLINQFAWQFQGPLSPARPLHSIKKAFVMNLVITPWWYNKLVLRDPAARQVYLTLKFLAIKPIIHTVHYATSINQQDIETIKASVISSLAPFIKS